MASHLPTSWPEWTNAPVELYHGTTMDFAESIVLSGVDVSFGRSRTDFGRGFYTTSRPDIARGWSQRVCRRVQDSSGAIVRLRISRAAISHLPSLCFIRSSMEAVAYWSFVQHCRHGLPHIQSTGAYYSVVSGPIAVRWSGPADSSTLFDSDQISFHSNAAQAMLNDRSVCQMEVLA
jgi:hypothetical protein